MNLKLLFTVILLIVLSGQTHVRSQDIDKELTALADKLAGPITDHGKKKVTVIDFTDLQGGSSELGKYIAEQLTVDLVMGKRDFSVLDRANLKSILAEHKLTAKGLVDPDTAKKIGMFTGVDALILGTIVPKDKSITLTAKIITTDTAEIVGAAKAQFNQDSTVQQLLSRPLSENQNGTGPGGSSDDGAVIVKSFGDLHIELQPVHIVEGRYLLLTMNMENKNAKKSIWVGLKSDRNQQVTGTLTDSDGNEFMSDLGRVSGIGVSYVSYYAPNAFDKATELKSGESISVAIKFWLTNSNHAPVAGDCRLQLEIVSGSGFNGIIVGPSTHNLMTKIRAN